jgi:hypothetical protein
MFSGKRSRDGKLESVIFVLRMQWKKKTHQQILTKNHIMNRALAFIMILAAGLPSCKQFAGEEIARLPIDKVSGYQLNYKEAAVELKKGDKISVWTELDVAYNGSPGMEFQLLIVSDGDTKWSFTGKLGSFTIDRDAKFTFYGILLAKDTAAITLKKADLILKK